MFLEQRQELAYLVVVVGDFSQIATEGITHFRGISEIRGQFYICSGITCGITFIPWRVGLVAACEDAERC